MRVSRKYVMMILAVMFALCAVGVSYGDGGDEPEYGGHLGSDPSASQANAQLRVDENPPYVVLRRGWGEKKTFHKEGNYWVIDELPRGTIVTVPEGYKARCISFHTKVVKGKAGKTFDNGRVIYSAGTNVKYTYPSFLQLYKNP